MNGEWVNDLAKDFNASQTAYKIVPTLKSSYNESMTGDSRFPCWQCALHPAGV